MSQRPRISVVILTANRCDQLRRCLDSLAQGTCLPGEVIVVLNAPGDGTAEALASLQFEFPIRTLETSGVGYAEARNRGIEVSTGEWVAFLDDDCQADARWLERIGDSLEENDVVGGVVLPLKPMRGTRDFSPELNWLAGLSGPGFFREDVGKVELPNTSNMAFRRVIWQEHPFQQIGGRLKSRQCKNYLLGREDAEWWRRLRRAGLRCGVARRAIAWHDIDGSRFEYLPSLSRARADSRAFWRRERPVRELPAAAADIVRYPLRVLEDLLRTDRSFAQLRRLHGTWVARQWALLESAVGDQNHGITPATRTGLLVRETWNMVSGQTKRLVRTALVFSHHTFKPIQPVPSPENPPQRLTVFCYNNLGDAILLLPVLEQLKAAYPDTTLTLIVGEVAAPLFEEIAFVDRVVALPSGLKTHRPRHAWQVWKTVRDTQPDAIILTYCHGAPPLGIFAATDAPVICWDNDHGMEQQLWHELARVLVPKSLKKVEIAHQLDLLTPLGVLGQVRRPHYSPPTRARERVDALLEANGLQPGKYAYVLLDNREDNFKFWPTERWADVARHLYEHYGLRVVFEGTRRGRRLYEALGLDEQIALSFHGLLDTAELAALLDRAAVALGIDSGPMHLAQAVRTPTLTLFGDIDETRWGPMPRLATDDPKDPLPYATVRAANAPFGWLPHERHGFAHNEHMMRLSSEEVIRALDELMGNYSSSDASNFTG